MWSPYRVETREDEAHLAETPDGCRVGLARYLPAAGGRRRHPVLLVHGLAACRVSFDLAPEVSLARALADAGWDTWSVELRGHGRACGPRSYGFDDHLERDVPAALARVREATGAPLVHAVGHSMGGILVLAHLARGARDLVSAAVIGSALDYSASASDFHHWVRLSALATVLPAVPLGALAALAAPLLARAPGPLGNVSPIERFMVWPSNVDPRLLRRLHGVAFHRVPTPVLAQLATAFRPGGLRSKDGSLVYLDGLRGVSTPVLSLVGDRDRQCHESAARRTMDVVRRGTVVQLGRAAGHGDHYGHFDPIIGRRARDEVWPHLLRWLAEHDA